MKACVLFGVSLAIPIYDGRQKQLKYSKINLQERTRLVNKQFFLNQYYQQVAQLKQQLHATDALVNSYKKSPTMAQKARKVRQQK